MRNLADDITGYGAESGEDRRFGQKEHADMARGQADNAVDTDFARTLVDCAGHGVEDDQRGDQHWNKELAGAADLGRADRTVGDDLVALADEERQGDPRHKGFDALGEVFVAGISRDGDRAQAAVHIDDALVGRKDSVGHLEVIEGLDGGRGLGARVLGVFAVDQCGVFDGIDGGKCLAIEVGDLF